MFFMAEYANMITVSCLATILFLGGWLSPLPDSWTWAHYIPVAALALGGAGLLLGGILREKGLGRFVFPTLGIMLLGAAYACVHSGVAEIVQGPFWFLTKVFFLLFFYVWTRGTLPRFRYDQLMSFGWKVLLPLSLANLVLTGLWLLMVHR
jgi:NADH-quinone oxidoreductase subunit H